MTVGGLDSITLFLFLRSIGINVPAVSVSSLEDKSIQLVHKALGIRSLPPIKDENGRPYTKMRVIQQYGYPVISKEAARVCVCGERERDYGTPENNFETIGLLWGVYLRAAHPELAKVMAVNHITAKDVAAMMGLLKVARIATGSSPDSFVDLAGYAACAGEIATKEDSNV